MDGEDEAVNQSAPVVETPHVPWKTCPKCWQRFLYSENCAVCGTRGRIGRFAKTASGRMVWPLDPRPEEIFIDDVAHHLAQQNRYAGGCRIPLSVAEHSVRVSWRIEQIMRGRNESVTRTRAASLLGLMHDSAEAYLVDLPKPVKADIPQYYVIEAKHEAAIANRFNLTTEFWPAVKVADDELLATEKRDLLPPWRDVETAPPSLDPTQPPLPEKIEPWDWIIARERFLFRFHTLTDGELE